MRNSAQWKAALLAGLVGIVSLAMHASVAAASFRLLVTDNSSPGLPLYIAIYPASAEEWESEPMYTLRKILPETEEVEVMLDIPAGDYGIRAFVDLDGDGELNLNRRDRPAEPYASSLNRDRNRRSRRFEHAIVSLSEETPSVGINLTYPRGSN